MLSSVNGFHLSIVNSSNTRMPRIPFTGFCAYLYILIYKGEVWYNHWCFFSAETCWSGVPELFSPEFYVFLIFKLI